MTIGRAADELHSSPEPTAPPPDAEELERPTQRQATAPSDAAEDGERRAREASPRAPGAGGEGAEPHTLEDSPRAPGAGERKASGIPERPASPPDPGRQTPQHPAGSAGAERSGKDLPDPVGEGAAAIAGSWPPAAREVAATSREGAQAGSEAGAAGRIAAQAGGAGKLAERRRGERRASAARDNGGRVWRGRVASGKGRPRRVRLVPLLLQRGLRRVTEAPLIGGNRARLLVDAPEAYPAMLKMIASAERSISFENYIFRDDAVGRRFAEAIRERARAGVEVRVLYDWFGSVATSNGFWRRMRQAGCQVRSFGSPSLRHPGRFFTRDHRKLLVVDGRVGVVGGFCIGAEWEDDRGLGRWRDTAARVEGPVALELERTFARIWRRAGGDDYWPGRPGAQPIRAGEVAIRVVDGPPAHARTYRLYQLLSALAERTLYVTGAYPLAPTALRRALVSAAHAGVDVRLLVPDRSDLRLLNQAARAHFARLLRNGVRIYLWNGPMLHAKTLVVDGVLALVGSSNLNPFSMLGCYELDVQLQDPGLASTLQRQFLLDLERAQELSLEEWRRRPTSQRVKERLGAGVLWLPYKLYSG